MANEWGGGQRVRRHGAKDNAPGWLEAGSPFGQLDLVEVERRLDLGEADRRDGGSGERRATGNRLDRQVESRDGCTEMDRLTGPTP